MSRLKDAMLTLFTGVKSKSDLASCFKRVKITPMLFTSKRPKNTKKNNNRHYDHLPNILLPDLSRHGVHLTPEGVLWYLTPRC